MNDRGRFLSFAGPQFPLLDPLSIVLGIPGVLPSVSPFSEGLSGLIRQTGTTKSSSPTYLKGYYCKASEVTTSLQGHTRLQQIGSLFNKMTCSCPVGGMKLKRA